MKRPKVTQPLTDNAERARRETKREAAPAGKGKAGPSRAHAHALDASGGGHSKKLGGTMPKKSGRTS